MQPVDTLPAPTLTLSRDSSNESISEPKGWTPLQRFLFRVAFIFFVIMSLPTSWQYYEDLVALDWLHLGYRDLTNLARFSPKFLELEGESARWGLVSYADFGLILAVALAGAVIWSVGGARRREYNRLYYWLRVLVRYRVALGMIEFGFVKLFLIQMPFPPQGTLATNLGDITAQKLYWLSVGIVPHYEIFLGFVEILAGTLLFFRRTTFLGAALTAGASANIVYINHAYDGGVHVYSAYFVILALFLMLYDLPRLWKLLVLEQDVVPVYHYPAFQKPWQQYGRYVLKAIPIFTYLGLMAYLHVLNYREEKLIKVPVTPGLAGAEGYYQVTEFRLNNKVLPYSPTDSVRWQDATFEKHSTLTFKVNQKVKLDLSNGVPHKKDESRTWELTGIAGGRRFFYYAADTLNQTLTLQDKHGNAGGEGRRGGGQNGQNRSNAKAASKLKKEKMILHYTRPNATRIILTGITSTKDSLYVVLDKVNRQYPLNATR
ncbi:hypothetical protein [Sabulibacter ruber]|uniref:hypothetical protein n=1 Tax=Sabulibacter ruber TaxID=2811901 RepID=UPI001A9569E5|nr:hypothetical protein [Sabulibacter ruber]